jgi:hypothetical protein
MAAIPSLLGAIVINIDEASIYHSPTYIASLNDYIGESTWDDAVERAPAFGPIKCRDHCWVGPIACSLDVQFREEAELRVEQAVGLDLALFDLL